jgi:hypothetical protein
MTWGKTGPEPQPRVIADCAWCGKPVKWAQRPSRQGAYCSRVCSGRGRAKGGLSFKDGRWQVHLRSGARQFYSRCLMEGHLGRHLTSEEVVHHMNEDKTDDRIENLEVVTPSRHTQIHASALLEARRRKAILKAHGRS